MGKEGEGGLESGLGLGGSRWRDPQCEISIQYREGPIMLEMTRESCLSCRY